MLHPVFSTLIQRPDLVADHMSAYAALIHDEASEAGNELIKRGVAWALVAIGALMFLILAGVALMLGLMMDQFHWVLLAVPGLMLVITLAAYARARAPASALRFQELKAQMQSDVQALRTAS